jgi:hypothetical protein
MWPSPFLPLAEHATFGQNCWDVSIGSVFVCISYSMPMDASFFQPPDFSPVRAALPIMPENANKKILVNPYLM